MLYSYSDPLSQQQQYQRELRNSDLVYFNDFYELFKTQEYTPQKKREFIKRRQSATTHNSGDRGLCSSCFRPFPRQWWLLQPNRIFCHFCLNYICPKCVYTKEQQIVIPSELQFRGTTKGSICKDAMDFMEQFKYIKIDKRNPLLVMPENRELR